MQFCVSHKKFKSNQIISNHIYSQIPRKNTVFWCTITKYTGCTRELGQPRAHSRQDMIEIEIVVEMKQLHSGLSTPQTPGHPSELRKGQPINNNVILRRCPFT